MIVVISDISHSSDGEVARTQLDHINAIAVRALKMDHQAPSRQHDMNGPRGWWEDW